MIIPAKSYHLLALIIFVAFGSCRSKHHPSELNNTPSLIKKYGKENFVPFRCFDFKTLEGASKITTDSLEYPYVLIHKTAKDNIPIIFFFNEKSYQEHIFVKGNNLYYSKSEHFSGLGPGKNDIVFIYPDSIVRYYTTCIDSSCQTGFINAKFFSSKTHSYRFDYMSIDAGIGNDGYRYDKIDFAEGKFSIIEDLTMLYKDEIFFENSEWKDSSNYIIETCYEYIWNDTLDKNEVDNISLNYYAKKNDYSKSWQTLRYIYNWEFYPGILSPEFTRMKYSRDIQ